ncbi:MAG TPA: CDP-glycerol glycerophosphotransferase family protein [Candidatus Scubalenecus merdavium]|uniref:CDP-glycerol glycerophosphotransferase family protein n=1 Tax=Candidatus Scybalenecus merdavium TaxID=2840939 RepID=A0A9D1MUV8_9FIRM|nr:CDP-glycerol glycerophosphotransferase family protein [Candidatus Scubalenecus merdavium]
MKNRIKAIVTELSKRNIVIRKVSRWLLYHYRYLVYAFIKAANKTDAKAICFKAFNGKSYSCSPKAIYEYMLTQEQFKDFKFIWVFKEPEKHRYLEKNPNTTLVQDSTRAYLKAMAVSKYWIHNYRVSDHIYPKENQIYVQCWHGTPLKKLGYDITKGDNVLNSIEEIRFKYKVDAAKFKAILSPSRFASEKFISAWNLKAIGKENCVIEQGYPRNDKLFHADEADRQRVRKALGIEGVNKKIIFYAPTWRDNQHDSTIGYTYKTEVDFDKLQEALGEEYIILFRAHYLVANSFDFEKYSGFVYDVSSYDDINDLYIVSDLLITDYSSVFFDYANLRRPMLFYMYDFDAYKNEMRDFYFDIDELPGPIVKDEDGLIEAIRGLDRYMLAYGEKYIAFHNKFNYLDDGHASARVVDAVMRL